MVSNPIKLGDPWAAQFEVFKRLQLTSRGRALAQGG